MSQDTDTRTVILTVTWEDGSPTTYQRSAREVPQIITELLTTYAGEWTGYTVRVRTP